jgi:hypothetical protein
VLLELVGPWASCNERVAEQPGGEVQVSRVSGDTDWAGLRVKEIGAEQLAWPPPASLPAGVLGQAGDVAAADGVTGLHVCEAAVEHSSGQPSSLLTAAVSRVADDAGMLTPCAAGAAGLQAEGSGNSSGPSVALPPAPLVAGVLGASGDEGAAADCGVPIPDARPASGAAAPAEPAMSPA